MTVTRSLLLFALAAVAEIGGAWLVWQGLRENRGVLWVARVCAGLYGVVATCSRTPSSADLAATAGVIAGSLAWGALVDGYRPDRFDLVGAAICLVGVAVIMYAPRA